MDYQGPCGADFANVAALNRAYVRYLRDTAAAGGGMQNLGPLFRTLLANLTEHQIERLAEAPFLLFSLREADGQFWCKLFSDAPHEDLFTEVMTADAARIVTAALAFLWQLANQNPFAARILAGATLTWCEQLAQSTLYKLLRRAGNEPALLEPRLADNTAFWQRLLSTGLHPEAGIRRAAQISALQMMLGERDSMAYRQLPAAACRLPAERLRIAEKHNSPKR